MIKSIDPGELCMGCMAQRENGEGPCPVCGFVEKDYQPAPHHLPCRSILNGKYLTGKVLGEGGFGIIYLGWDLNLDMKVAIKEYYPSGFVTREATSSNTVMTYTGDKSEAYHRGKERFMGEAKVLAKFFSLPGIVSVKDFFLENNTAYIVMEYLEGMTLKQYLQRQGGKLPAGELFSRMRPVMQSLEQVHRAGLIHRDISPDNIMLTGSGQMKLLDFGAARDISADGQKSLSVLLKPGYAPEEQYRTHGEQGPWTDVYALCATLYKCLTGITPEESLERLGEDPLVPPSGRGADTTPAQDAALMQGLAVKAPARFRTMGALEGALYRTAPPPVKPQPVPPTPPVSGDTPTVPLTPASGDSPTMPLSGVSGQSVLAGQETAKWGKAAFWICLAIGGLSFLLRLVYQLNFISWIPNITCLYNTNFVLYLLYALQAPCLLFAFAYGVYIRAKKKGTLPDNLPGSAVRRKTIIVTAVVQLLAYLAAYYCYSQFYARVLAFMDWSGISYDMVLSLLLLLMMLFSGKLLAMLFAMSKQGENQTRKKAKMAAIILLAGTALASFGYYGNFCEALYKLLGTNGMWMTFTASSFLAQGLLCVCVTLFFLSWEQIRSGTKNRGLLIASMCFTVVSMVFLLLYHPNPYALYHLFS